MMKGTILKLLSNNLFTCTSYIPHWKINRGSYMSAHVSLNLLNELSKRSNARIAEHFIYFAQQV